jgi:hypothetical protein
LVKEKMPVKGRAELSFMLGDGGKKKGSAQYSSRVQGRGSAVESSVSGRVCGSNGQ